MAAVLNKFQESLELAWATRHQNLQRMVSLSTAMMRLAKEKADSLAIGLAYRNLGYADFINGELDSAWERLNHALEIGRRHSAALTADASNALAAVYKTMGKTNTARMFLENAIRILEELNDTPNVVPLKMNLGLLLQDLQRHEEALAQFEEVLSDLQQNPNLTRELETKGNQALSLLALGQEQAAEILLEQVVATAQSQKLQVHEINNLVNLGEVYTKRKRYSEALNVLQQAMKFIDKGIAITVKSYCYLNIATVQEQLEDWQSALFSLEQATLAASHHQIIPIQAQIAQAKHRILLKTHNYQAALEAFEQYHQIYVTIRNNDAEKELRFFKLERDFEKTINEAEMSRIKNVELAELLQEVQAANQEKAKLLEELGVKTNALEVMSVQDALTGIHNRRYLEQSLELELHKAKRGLYPLSIALLDIDNFKGVNDNFSHQIGDQALIIIGELMRNCIRTNDIAARYGGEEFVLALPRATAQQSEMVCERLRKSIENYPWHQLHPDLRITASIGICDDTSVANYEQLLHLADTQMYRAKRNGKNRVFTEATRVDMTSVIS